MKYRGCVAQIGAAVKQLQIAANDGDASVPELNPTVLYAARERIARTILRKDHGVAKRQQGFIALDEATTASAFVDLESMYGRQVLAAWLMGALTGRRAATCLEIQLQHVYFYASVAKYGSQEVLIPACLMYFQSEKTPDDQGPRFLRFDRAGCENMSEFVGQDLSLALYDMLCCRGAFVGGEPLKRAMPGGALPFHESAHAWFLFCEIKDGVPLDSYPLERHRFSDYSREVLAAMGRPPRGVRAQRAGVVTRALIKHLVERKGSEISDDALRGVCRLGGWSVIELSTVRDVYLKKVFDSFLNADGLALGHEWDDAQQAAALKRFQGQVLRPAVGTQLIGAGTGGGSRGAHLTVLAAAAGEFGAAALAEGRARLPVNGFLDSRATLQHHCDRFPRNSAVVLFHVATDLQFHFRSQPQAMLVLPGGLAAPKHSTF